jgi:tRNA pseudouridine38-40 synthase
LPPGPALGGFRGGLPPGLAAVGPGDEGTGPRGERGVPGRGVGGPAPAAAECPPGPALIRVRLDIGYDGTGFSGWARQPGQRTVQGILEDALARVLGLAGSAALTVAGRTDAGVHARGQVAHADIPADRWADAGHTAERRLARLLPPDVRVHRLTLAPPGFDARFSAIWRRYAYRVCDDPALADPLARHVTLWVRSRLDTGAMNEAARRCLGEHDFAAFCRRREGASTVRTLLRLDWARPAPAVAEATVVADAFCHNMVRALVGALLKVGDGSHPPGWPAEVLAARVRDPAVPVVGPHGLCLEEVGYPADAGLAVRAATARHLRTAPATSGPPPA